MTTQPSCYGKSWDPNHVECRGGLDPAYENPRDKTHRRDRCSWFTPCSQAVAATQIIPTQSLVHRPTMIPAAHPPSPPTAFTPPRPPTQHMPPPTAPTPSYQPQYMQTQYAQAPRVQTQYAQPQYAPQQPAPAQQYYPQPIQQGMVPPHVAQYGPPLVYQPYQMPGSQMPQYLTVPEPVSDNVHWIARLGHEILRSIMKACGHTMAAHFDSNPIRRHDKQ